VSSDFIFLGSDRDSPGYDIGYSFVAPDAETCATTCLATPGCVGFGFYIGPRYPDVYSNCYLKSQLVIPGPLLDGFYLYKLASSIPPPPQPPPPALVGNGGYQLVIEGGTCNGNDLLQFVKATLDQCAQRCTAAPGCNGFEFNSNLNPGGCYVKTSIVPSPPGGSIDPTGFFCYQRVFTTPPSPPSPPNPLAPPNPPPSPPPPVGLFTKMRVPSYPVDTDVNSTVISAVSSLFTNLTSITSAPTVQVAYDAYFDFYTSDTTHSTTDFYGAIAQTLGAVNASASQVTTASTQSLAHRRALLQQPTYVEYTLNGTAVFSSSALLQSAQSSFSNTTLKAIMDSLNMNSTGAWLVWTLNGVSFSFYYTVPASVAPNVTTTVQSPPFQNNFTAFFNNNVNPNITSVVVVNAAPSPPPPFINADASAPPPPKFVGSTTFWVIIAFAAFAAVTAGFTLIISLYFRDLRGTKRHMR